MLKLAMIFKLHGNDLHVKFHHKTYKGEWKIIFVTNVPFLPLGLTLYNIIKILQISWTIIKTESLALFTEVLPKLLGKISDLAFLVVVVCFGGIITVKLVA